MFRLSNPNVFKPWFAYDTHKTLSKIQGSLTTLQLRWFIKTWNKNFAANLDDLIIGEELYNILYNNSIFKSLLLNKPEEFKHWFKNIFFINKIITPPEFSIYYRYISYLFFEYIKILFFYQKYLKDIFKYFLINYQREVNKIYLPDETDVEKIIQKRKEKLEQKNSQDSSNESEKKKPTFEEKVVYALNNRKKKITYTELLYRKDSFGLHLFTYLKKLITLDYLYSLEKNKTYSLNNLIFLEDILKINFINKTILYNTIMQKKQEILKYI